MTKSNSVPQRLFKIGSMTVKDELSALPFKKGFEFLAKKYPQIRHTQVFESDGVAQDDGSILYDVPLMKVATNG